jgi:hypothetical protein
MTACGVPAVVALYIHLIFEIVQFEGIVFRFEDLIAAGPPPTGFSYLFASATAAALQH